GRGERRRGRRRRRGRHRSRPEMPASRQRRPAARRSASRRRYGSETSAPRCAAESNPPRATDPSARPAGRRAAGARRATRSPRSRETRAGLCAVDDPVVDYALVSDAMLTDALFRVPRRDGLQLLQRRDGTLARELTSWRLHLSPGASQNYNAPDEETIVVLQEGAGSFTVGGSTWTVHRANVFDERATALYLPPGRELTVRADSNLEAVLVSTPAPAGGEPGLVGPASIDPQRRGRDFYTRDVHNILVTDPHGRRLMVGE